MKTKKNKSKEKVTRKLNPKQELFCRYYTQNTSLFGNATMSYARAYGFDLDNLSTDAVYEEVEQDDGRFISKKVEDSPYDLAYGVCKTAGNRLLTLVHINTRISKLLLDFLTPENVDAEMAWVISQRENLSAKNAATREYNKLRGRIIDRFEINDIPVDDKDKSASNKVLADFLHGLAKNS